MPVLLDHWETPITKSPPAVRPIATRPTRPSPINTAVLPRVPTKPEFPVEQGLLNIWTRPSDWTKYESQSNYMAADAFLLTYPRWHPRRQTWVPPPLSNTRMQSEGSVKINGLFSFYFGRRPWGVGSERQTQKTINVAMPVILNGGPD